MSTGDASPTPGRSSLASFFDPRSVVLVGASSNPRKWGHLVAEKLLPGQARRTVHLVNRSGEPVLGAPTFRSVEDLPDVPELAVLTVPAAGFLDALDQVLAAGTKAIIAITSGFVETGADGGRLEAEAVSRIRAAGARLVGPNCNGICDTTSDFSCMAWFQPRPGSVAVISQSGTVIMDAERRLVTLGLGLSRGVSVGNQADVSISDFIMDAVQHDGTDRILLYLEDVRDGRALFRAAGAAVDAGKPVVVLAAKAAAAARRAAKSHTGSMLSDFRVLQAAADASGVTVVSSLREAADAVHVLGLPARVSGRRTAVLTDAGGFAVMAGSAIDDAGLEMPEFSASLRAQIAEEMSIEAGIANPVDAAWIENVEGVTSLTRDILASGEVDHLMLALAAFHHDSPAEQRRVGEELADTIIRSGKSVIVVTPDRDNPGVAALREARVPVLADLDAAARGFCTLIESHRLPIGPTLPHAALPADATSYFGARALLESHGVPVASARRVSSIDEALAAADLVGPPVVVKALGLLHKSDAGGVAIGVQLADLQAVTEAMQQRLSPEGFSIEEMVPHDDAVELIVGAKRDPQFGPVAMVGLGGIYTELLGDFSVALAPVDLATAERMVSELRGAPLLRGMRGRPAVHLAAIHEAMVAVSRVMATHPEISELEINPLLAGPSGVTALDARILTT